LLASAPSLLQLTQQAAQWQHTAHSVLTWQCQLSRHMFYMYAYGNGNVFQQLHVANNQTVFNWLHCAKDMAPALGRDRHKYHDALKRQSSYHEP
jgi:hypothetical protein